MQAKKVKFGGRTYPIQLSMAAWLDAAAELDMELGEMIESLKGANSTRLFYRVLYHEFRHGAEVSGEVFDMDFYTFTDMCFVYVKELEPLIEQTQKHFENIVAEMEKANLGSSSNGEAKKKKVTRSRRVVKEKS